MKLFNTLFLCILFLSVGYSQNIPFDKEVYKTWIDMRVGNGHDPAYWYCYGEVYSYPEGKLIARMQGVDVAKLIPVTVDSMIQLNRKIFLYLDKETGEVLRTYNDQPVSHIKYPYQMIEYILKGDQLITYVTQGSGKRVSRIGPGSNTAARKVGETHYFSSPVFLDFPIPGGRYQAVENYDFIVNPNAQSTVDKYQLTWWRYGAMAPFFGKKQGTIQLVCYRVDTFEDLPEPLQSYIRDEASLWMKPPQSLEEIKSLQTK